MIRQLRRGLCRRSETNRQGRLYRYGSLSVQVQDDLADVTLLAKGVLSGPYIAKGIGFGDQRGYVAALDPLDKVSEDLRLQHGAPEEAQILEIERAHVQLDNWSGDCARDGVASARTQDIQQRWPFRAGDKVNHRVDLTHTKGGQVIRIPVERLIRAEGLQLVGLAGARDRDEFLRHGQTPVARSPIPPHWTPLSQARFRLP